MKKDIHPEYRSVVSMDTTTGYKFLSGSTKYEETVVPKVKHSIDPCWKFHQTHTHSTLDVKSLLKQYGRGSFQQKYGLNKTTKPLPFGSGFWSLLFLLWTHKIRG